VAAALLALALALAPAAVALAEPVVIVYVRRSGEAIEATVTVTDDDGNTASCETQNGSCSLSGLTPGRHLVVAQARDGQRAQSRPVLIPPDGKVSLFVSVP
jgi:outer membrane usher protein FimD/PapC